MVDLDRVEGYVEAGAIDRRRHGRPHAQLHLGAELVQRRDPAGVAHLVVTAASS